MLRTLRDFTKHQRDLGNTLHILKNPAMYHYNYRLTKRRVVHPIINSSEKTLI